MLMKYLGGAALASAILFGAGHLFVLQREQHAILKELQEIKTILQGQQLAQPGRPSSGPTGTSDTVPANLTLTVDHGAVKGRADARVTIVEFSDFECPFCGRYTRETFSQVDRAYVQTGKVRYAFRHFPLERIHPRALKAGEAAECARQQDRFWPVHDRLFANQNALGDADLVNIARTVGLDVVRFERCVGGEATTKVRQDLDLGSRAGVTGTPAFFIGLTQPDGSVRVMKKLVGAKSFEAFQAAIDGLIASSAATN